MNWILEIIEGCIALAIILGLFALGRELRTGLEENEFYADSF